MKILMGLMVGVAVSFMAVGSSFAVPDLQLDIIDGTYYGKGPYDETTVSNGPVFTLQAYLQPSDNNTIGDLYYISMAVVPMTGPESQDFGSFVFAGQTINVTADMVYGVPPVELDGTSVKDPGDLPGHGIYETFYYELELSFQGSGTVAAYNVQSGEEESGRTMNAIEFAVDTTGLNDGIEIHFDLYNTKLKCGDVDVSWKAPFSKDAQSSSVTHNVPEPATMLLLGSGILGLGLLRRKNRL